MSNIISNLMIQMVAMMMMKMVTKMTKITKEDSELLLVARRSHLKGRAPFRERDQIDLEDNLIFCFFYHLNFVLHIFFLGFIGYQRDLEDNLIFRFFTFEFCPPYFFEVYERL